MFPEFQEECYIQNGTQLFRITKRVDPLGHPEALRLQLEDAYRYDDLPNGRRRYAKHWLTFSEIKRAKFDLVQFHPAELPARFRTPALLAPAPASEEEERAHNPRHAPSAQGPG